MKKALILASGGIDSLTIIAKVIEDNYVPVILSFNYNQTNLVELNYLKKSLKQFEEIVSIKFNAKIQHIIINLNFDLFKSNLLQKNHHFNTLNNTNNKLNNNYNLDDIENSNMQTNNKERDNSNDINCKDNIVNNTNNIEKYNTISDLPLNSKPSTYVPARNTIFASYALGLAESLDIDRIFLGIHKQDAPNYPDCSYEYFLALKNLFLIASENKVTVNAPLINLNKADIIKIGLSLKVDYSNTISCYDPIVYDVNNINNAIVLNNVEAKACKKCHACIIRLEAFAKNNIVEKYVN
ncbi:MAG: 7-cyano-7-deazaguanine synthase [Rickettsiales bacterium]